MITNYLATLLPEGDYPDNDVETVKPIKRLPAELSFHESLKARIKYDSNKRSLIVRGVMKFQEKEELLRLSTDAAYCEAISMLHEKSRLNWLVAQLFSL
jgi:hypothetical protein